MSGNPQVRVEVAQSEGRGGARLHVWNWEHVSVSAAPLHDLLVGHLSLHQACRVHVAGLAGEIEEAFCQLANEDLSLELLRQHVRRRVRLAHHFQFVDYNLPLGVAGLHLDEISCVALFVSGLRVVTDLLWIVRKVDDSNHLGVAIVRAIFFLFTSLQARQLLPLLLARLLLHGLVDSVECLLQGCLHVLPCLCLCPCLLGNLLLYSKVVEAHCLGASLGRLLDARAPPVRAGPVHPLQAGRAPVADRRGHAGLKHL
mmetsp:Transcript_77089/g.226107  ORF Transcript_77089/g.226107 Transcript_77089/m.226107 type:complete len:257 (-) Transcript_77089:1301-2071(-)